MTKKYVIREIDFGYNDEYYTSYDAHLGKIQHIYDDKTQAEIHHKALVVEALKNADLESYSFGYGDADEDTYLAVEALVLEKTGEKYDKDDGIPKLDDDALFEFATLTGITLYQLLEIDEDEKFYVIWLPQAESYFTDYDTGNIFTGHSADFIRSHDDDWYFLQEISTRLSGSLDDLSDAPQLLKVVIEKNSGLNYSNTEHYLEIDANHAGYDAISEINALLKQPLFEIQAKNLAEFQAISA
jgi:hypothetical protein